MPGQSVIESQGAPSAPQGADRPAPSHGVLPGQGALKVRRSVATKLLVSLVLVGGEVVAERGVVVPRGRTVSDPDDSLDDLPLPAVVKPAWEGSSKGIRSTSLVTHRDELRARVVEMLAAYRQPVLVEEFIDGEEVTVAALGNAPWWMGAMRVLPRKASGPFIYSLEVKRDWENQVSYEAPAALGDVATRALFSAAEKILKILEVRDVGRMDFRVRHGVPYFLEINPLPGLDPRTGDLCILARGHGLDHAGVIGRILQAAATRHGLGA